MFNVKHESYFRTMALMSKVLATSADSHVTTEKVENWISSWVTVLSPSWTKGSIGMVSKSACQHTKSRNSVIIMSNAVVKRRNFYSFYSHWAVRCLQQSSYITHPGYIQHITCECTVYSYVSHMPNQMESFGFWDCVFQFGLSTAVELKLFAFCVIRASQHLQLY